MVVLLNSCGPTKILSSVEYARLEKIEVKYRYPDYVGWLTWMNTRKPVVYYETEIKVEDTANYRVGMYMIVLMRR